VIYGLVGRSAASSRRLQREGKPAWARVTSVEDTGVTVNQNPRIAITLHVEPDGEPAFEIATKKVVSRLSVPQVGSTVAIRYDPNDHERFVFDDGSALAAGAAGAQGVPARFEQSLRLALAQKGVTGELQERAVREALAAAGSGATTIDLREYTQGRSEDEEDDRLERLKKLGELKASGVLTESEFEAEKAKILAEG
jgi:hypothetical protein